MKENKIIVAGIGPGSPEDITPAVVSALKESDVVIGYKYYFQFITQWLAEGTECVDTGMKREKARAELAFEYAEQGKTVCVISSGDAGIYGMAPLIYEMKRNGGVSRDPCAARYSVLSRKLRHCWVLPSVMIFALSLCPT